MAKINLQEKLEQERQKSIDSTEKTVKEVKLLVAGQSQDERNVLKSVGLGHAIEDVEKARGLNLERAQFEEQFKGRKVFTREEIKTLAIKYDLRFLKSERFNGTVDLKLGKVLVDFYKENGMEINDYDNKMLLYILAPKKLFNLEKRPKIHRPKLRLDPVLFYKIPGRHGAEDQFVFIHQWGNDFSPMRYFYGLLRENAASNFWMNAAMAFMPVSALLGMTGVNPWGGLALSIGASFIIAATIMGIKTNDLRDANDAFNSNSWDSVQE